MYSRPILRGKSQDEISGLLGATGACRRRTMTRYEKGDRNPSISRTMLLAKLLNVSYYAIKRYDYTDPLDFIYTLLWMEELFPNYHFGIRNT